MVFGTGLDRCRGVYGTYLGIGSGVSGWDKGSYWFNLPIEAERGDIESRWDMEREAKRRRPSVTVTLR